jgi:hypothetical protein
MFAVKVGNYPFEGETLDSRNQTRDGALMSTQDELGSTVGEFRASFDAFGTARPVAGFPAGSPEAKIEALEEYVRMLYRGMELLARQIDDLASRS